MTTVPAPAYFNATPSAHAFPVTITALPTPAQLTIVASVKCNTTTTGGEVMSYINSWAFSIGLCNGATNPTTAIGMHFYDQASYKQVVPAHGLTSGPSYYVAAVHDGTNIVYYVCAYPKGTCASTSLPDADKLAYSGTTANIGAGADGSRKLSGDLWDLALYASPLSAAQIQAQSDAMRADPYPTPTPTPTPAPVYFNATPSAHAFPVTVTALPTPPQLTITASVKCNTTTTGGEVMSYINSWAFSIGLCNGATNPTTSVGMHFYDQATYKQVVPVNGLSSGPSYFLAAVHDGTNIIYYVCAHPNGTCASTSLPDTDKLTYNGTTANIGAAADGSRKLSGDLWDLALYAAPLSAAQIQAKSNAMRADPYPTPVPTPVYFNATPSAHAFPVTVTALPTPAQLTIAASVKCNATTTGGEVMSYINSWAFSIGLCNGASNPTTSVGMHFYDQATYKQVVPANGLNSGPSYYVAAVHDGTNIIYYICAYPKGACSATSSPDADKLAYSGTSANIGAGADGSRKLSGDLWDLALYAAPLSAAQIQAKSDAMRADPYPTPNPCLGGAVTGSATQAPISQRLSTFTAIDTTSRRPYHKMLPPALSRAYFGIQTSTTTTNMTCHGGPIQTSPKVYLVFWGASWADTSISGGDPYGMRDRVIAWTQAMAGSGWKNTDTQYLDSSGRFVGNGTSLYAGVLNDTTSVVPAVPQQSDLANEAAMAAAHFGDYSVSANYVVLTPNTVRPSGFTTNYCAWHSYMYVNGSTEPYTNMPYVAGVPNCGSYAVNAGQIGINDGVSIVLGHEQAEVETDPLLNAWYDSTGAETGDKCAWTNLLDNSKAAGFPTQPLWNNGGTDCVQAY